MTGKKTYRGTAIASQPSVLLRSATNIARNPTKGRLKHPEVALVPVHAGYLDTDRARRRLGTVANKAARAVGHAAMARSATLERTPSGISKRQAFADLWRDGCHAGIPQGRSATTLLLMKGDWEVTYRPLHDRADLDPDAKVQALCLALAVCSAFWSQAQPPATRLGSDKGRGEDGAPEAVLARQRRPALQRSLGLDAAQGHRARRCPQHR